MPGLVNAHTHVALNSCRGLTYNSGHSLYDIMWPLEKYLTADDVKALAAVGILESLKAGTTTIADHYFFMEEIAGVVAETGIRGVLGHTIMAQDGPFCGAAEYEAGVAFARKWKGRHPRIHPVLAPHAPDTVTTEWLVELARIAEAEDFKLHLHVAQTQREIDLIGKRSGGKGSIAFLKEIGFLGPRVLAAHCIWISDEELQILAESGATAAYCPTVHSLHGNGLRAVELLEAGGKVALGSDCAAGNDDMDMFEEMRMAAASQSLLLRRDRAMKPDLLLAMATRGNAEALGVGALTGSLEPGKQADLLILRADAPRMTPLLNPVANTVMCGSESVIERVIVAGETVVQDGKVLTVDEAEVVRAGSAAVRRVMERARASNPDLFEFFLRTSPGLQ
jgi:5-methylthioadenosine/S-adenosylhomocysteine deaminase